MTKVCIKLQFAKNFGQTQQYFFQSNETRKTQDVDPPYSTVPFVVAQFEWETQDIYG